jgi:hypothetical protein
MGTKFSYDDSRLHGRFCYAHETTVPVTVRCCLICRVFFLAATASRGHRKRSEHRPGLHDHARATKSSLNNTTSSKVNRRECFLASVHIKLVIFNLILCSSSECFSPDTAASRRRRQRLGHHDQVRATQSERLRGQRPWLHDQVTCDAQETAPRATASVQQSSICVAARASAWAPRLSTVPSVCACSK